MKYEEKVKKQSIQLRKNGLSLGEISSKLSVPKTTIQLWTQGILLDKGQVARLKRKAHVALQFGRENSQLLKSQERNRRLDSFRDRGIKDIGQLSERDLLVLGASLYWAEGFKSIHEHRLGFCNSDPRMLRLYISFLDKILKIKSSSLTARLTLNESYKEKTQEIQDYWSKTLGIPMTQFTKPFYQKVQWKKQFTDQNYKGVLRIHVQESSNHLAYMRGLIQGLALELE